MKDEVITKDVIHEHDDLAEDIAWLLDQISQEVEEAAEERQKQKEERKRNSTEKALELVHTLYVRRDAHENVYLFLPQKGYLPLEGAYAQDWLTGQAAAWGLISQESLRKITLLARAKSLEQPPFTPRKRVWREQDEVRINVGDGRYVRIRPERITLAQVTPQTPFLGFVPPLPAPAKADPTEAREEFFRLLACLPEEDRWVALGWLAANLAHEEGLGLIIQGPHGSGKTVMTRLLSWLIDGGEWKSRAVKLRRMDEIAVVAARHEIIGLDNLSRLTDEEADILAQLITSMNWARRRLYTNADLYEMTVTGKVILNGVEISGLRGDLMSRLIPLKTVPNTNPTPEEKIKEQAEKLRPRLLYTLCLAIQHALRSTPDRLTGERMPAWAHTFCAALEFLGHPDPRELLARKRQESEQDDKFLQAILYLLEQHDGELEGYATNIAQLLAEECEITVSAVGLGKLLRYIETPLARHGVSVERRLVAGRTKYRIRYEKGAPAPEEDIEVPGFEPLEAGTEEETPEAPAPQELEKKINVEVSCLTCNWYAPSLNGPTCWLEPGQVKRLPEVRKDCPYWQADDRTLLALAQKGA